MALPRCAVGLSAVCDCDISWSYSLTIKYLDHEERAYLYESVHEICSYRISAKASNNR